MTDCCPICLENIETELFVTKCGHKFHNNCAEQLKESGHNKCPMCREVIFEEETRIPHIFLLERRAYFVYLDPASEDENLESARIISENVFHAVFDTEEGVNVIRNLLDAFNQEDNNQ